MSKSRKSNQSRTATGKRQSSEPAADESSAGKTSPQRNDSMRETIESIVVAFVLAFLFRAFEAEAFVIPTGSMAPTLYGRHKDATCVKCGYHFKIAASDEVDNDGILQPDSRIKSAMCPNCRYHMRDWTGEDGKRRSFKDLPVFKGDRILVNKFPYEFGDPRRWDVVVFKYPEEPKTNYIKRLVALPGESIMIKRGDLYKKDDAGVWRILRKDDPDKQRELQIAVYDNDYPETQLHECGWPQRWSAVEQGGGGAEIAGWSESQNGWSPQASTNSFRLNLDQTQDGQHRWLRYRHFVPNPDAWELAESRTESGGKIREFENVWPELISDYCGYNSYRGGQQGDLYRDFYWVGDLTVACEVAVEELGDAAELMFELNEGDRRYRCRFDVATGKATCLYLPGFNRDEEEEQILATAVTKLKGTGTFQIRFANVDNRLCLWIDEDLVDFNEDTAFDLTELHNPSPQESDLIPVGIAARGVAATVSHLLVQRDIYYRSERVVDDADTSRSPISRQESTWESGLKSELSNPHGWYDKYKQSMAAATFELGPDEYLMLGDNSPRSKDSRLWSNTRKARHRYAVKRTALVGKAFFIYWPHGVPFLNDGDGYPLPIFKHKRRAYTHNGRLVLEDTNYPAYRLPFYPQITRMHRIR